MNKFKTIGIGEILWDEFPGFKKLGGAPANFAFHTDRLGADSMIISCVGEDAAGDEIEKALTDKKINCFLLKDPVHPTGRVSIKTDSKNNPEYTIHENTAWDNLPFNTSFYDIAKKADLINFGSLAQRNTVSGISIKTFIKAAKPGCIKLFDINLRQHYYSKAIISELIELADILKLNHHELDIIAEMFLSHTHETDCLKELISLFNLKAVVLTKGSDGSRLFDKDFNDSTYRPEPVNVVDSVGAGDSFSAAFAIGYLKGFPLDKINEIASSVASYVCSQKGATPEMPAEIIQSIN